MGEGESLGCEAVFLGEFEPRRVDVDGDDLARASGLGEHAREEADRACTEDEDGLACRQRGAPRCVNEDGEGFGK